MNGEEARRRLFEYIDGELSEADERAFLARFSDDDELARLYRRERAIEETCARAARDVSAMPDELWARLTDAIRGEAAADREAAARREAAAHREAAAQREAAARAEAAAAAAPVAAPPVARPRRPGFMPVAAVGALAAASLALVLLAPAPPDARARDMLDLAQKKHAAAAEALPASVSVDRAAAALGIPVADLNLPERTRVNGHPVRRLAIECPDGKPCVFVYYTCCGKPVTGMILRKDDPVGQQIAKQVRTRERARLAPSARTNTISVVYGDHGRQEIALVLNDL